MLIERVNEMKLWRKYPWIECQMMHSYNSMKQFAFLDSNLDNINLIIGVGTVGREKATSIWRRGRSDILEI